MEMGFISMRVRTENMPVNFRVSLSLQIFHYTLNQAGS